MFCPKCGKQLPDDSAFCDACGYDLRKREAARKPFRKRLLVIILLAVAAAIVVIVLLNTNKGKTGSMESVTASASLSSSSQTAEEQAIDVSPLRIDIFQSKLIDMVVSNKSNFGGKSDDAIKAFLLNPNYEPPSLPSYDNGIAGYYTYTIDRWTEVAFSLNTGGYLTSVMFCNKADNYGTTVNENLDEAIVIFTSLVCILNNTDYSNDYNPDTLISNAVDCESSEMVDVGRYITFVNGKITNGLTGYKDSITKTVTTVSKGNDYSLSTDFYYTFNSDGEESSRNET